MGCENMSKIFKIDGIFYVFNEWTIVINDEILEKIKGYKLTDEFLLLDTNNKVITTAKFSDHFRRYQSGKLSVGLTINDKVLEEEIKKVKSFMYDNGLS